MDKKEYKSHLSLSILSSLGTARGSCILFMWEPHKKCHLTNRCCAAQVRGKAMLEASLGAYVQGELMEGDNQYHCDQINAKARPLSQADWPPVIKRRCLLVLLAALAPPVWSWRWCCVLGEQAGCGTWWHTSCSCVETAQA